MAALGVLAATSLAACGSKDFADNPRPAAALDVGARIDSKQVVVSPGRFGAGLISFTVVNFSNSPARFELSGPNDGSSQEIAPGAAGSLQINLPQGDYRASAGRGSNIRPAKITVGPKRASSGNKLLLP